MHHGFVGIGIDAQIQTRGELDCPQHAHGIFSETDHRITDRAHGARVDVGHSAAPIQHRRRVQVVEQRVDRKSRRTASSSARPNALSSRINKSSERSDSVGLRRKVAVSITLPSPNNTCTRRKRRPMIRRVAKQSAHGIGRALVATSKSFGDLPSNKSRTQPPTR